MKNKLYIVITFILLLLTINKVNASSVITYENSQNITEEHYMLNTIKYIKDRYFIIKESFDSTTLVSATKEETIATKEFPNFINISLISSEESIILVGKENNKLKVYKVDENLQIINQKETQTILQNNVNFKLYKKDNKIYVTIMENNLLYETNIYEIDSLLNVTSNKLSSYDATFLKSLFKADYYLIHHNDEIINERIIHYNDTTHSKNYNILVGNSSNVLYDELTGYSAKGILKIFDKEETEIVTIENDKYKNFLKVEIIKDKIVILATNDFEEYLLTYNYSGTLEDETLIVTEPVKEDYRLTSIDMHKTNNKLIVYATDATSRLLPLRKFLYIYNFECTITKSISINGTLDVISTAKPNEVVTLSITPNSGYMVEEIIVEDTQGNIIEVIDNKFIMPENDVTVTINYKATIINPETIDIISLVATFSIIGLIFVVTLKKKLNWLE